MPARDLFGVALRVLGVWFLVQAGTELIFLLLRLNMDLQGLRGEITQDKLFVGYNAALALVLLIGADHIVKLAYGPANAKAPTVAD